MNGPSPLQVDAQRLWADVMALAAITEPGRPFTRRSFSPLFLEGRVWLRQRFEAAGLACQIDAGGNLIGRREGTDPQAATIMLGSHSDTVPDGGRFDGIAGLLAALEALRVLADRGQELRHALELVDFLAEEPSDFGLSCVGSRAMSGRLTPAQLEYPAPWDERLGPAIDRMGGAVTDIRTAARGDIAAFLELHIEQGVVLEQDAVSIGVVEAIAGITRFELLFTGRADHAGTTPMNRRRDAAVAAASVIGFVAQTASELASSGQGHVAATVGVVEIRPNAANVVPRSARLVVDLRVSQRPVAVCFTEALHEAARHAAEAARVSLTRFEILSDTHPVPCDEGLRALLTGAAAKLGLSSVPIVSGAGHDAAHIAAVAPSAMIFIPCRDGRSHDPEEWAEPAALAEGAAVLLHAVLARDAQASRQITESLDRLVPGT